MEKENITQKGPKAFVAILVALAAFMVTWSAWTLHRSYNGPIEPNQALPRSTFVIGDGPMRSVADLEIASTAEQIRRGLMARDSVNGDGMAFRLPDETVAFWMKGTRIPLDIAFISPEGIVLNVERGEPFDEKLIRSEGDARLAIEVPAGRARLLGLKKGALVREDRKAPMGE